MAADDRRERFAQMTESVIRSSLDDGCFRLLAWLDKEIGGKPWTRTVAQAGAGLSWQHRTVTKHAEHLAQIGFVKIGRRSDVASADLRLLVRPGTPGLALPKPVPIKHRRRPTIGERARSKFAAAAALLTGFPDPIPRPLAHTPGHPRSAQVLVLRVARVLPSRSARVLTA